MMPRVAALSRVGIDGHRLDDVRDDQDLEAQEDGLADLLALARS